MQNRVYGLFLASIVVASACVDEDGGTTTIASPLGVTEDDEEAHELGAEALEGGEIVIDALPCGLSVIYHQRSTSHWIRNCEERGIRGEIIIWHDGIIYSGDAYEIPAQSLVSGSVRGRVIRLRRN